ncbi:hypothetical protein [Paludisphaera rhizosphaerae]|uniref:hypothetical protein n=1 Tax=Paludisphaera rhizosphaerae TaxID=2711216 RepID=UPI0013EDCA56|nr:hypothetical protein [Paludisphaera rhizosphaerae]
MRSDPDFAEPIVDKPLAPSSGTTLAWTWLGVALVNMLVPGGLGLLLTFNAGLVGMALGIAAVLGLGWYAAHIVPQVVRTVVHGGWIVAVVQFFPLLQIAAGSVGVEIVKALGLAEDSNPTIGTVSGGFLATIITAALLIALAWMLGLVGRAVAFLVRRVGGWGASEPIPKEA